LAVAFLFADRSIGQLADDVEMAGVTGVFLEDVEEDPVQGRWIFGWLEAAARPRSVP
jgi:hypothetical protein